MKKIIEKWYRALPFPKEFDGMFSEILERTSLEGITTIEEYPSANTPWDDIGRAERNLMAYLFFCEETERRYAGKGLPHDVFLATMNDIVRWSSLFYQATGKLGLIELSWTSLHHKLQIFELGRLQFNFCKLTSSPISELNAGVGTPCIGTHIPAAGPLKTEDALASFRAADAFFPKYFPEYSYDFYTCQSWLLDPDLADIIGKDSNIVRFAGLFCPFGSQPSNICLRYLFTADTDEHNVAARTPVSRLAAAAKERVLAGGTFHSVSGYRMKGAQ